MFDAAIAALLLVGQSTAATGAGTPPPVIVPTRTQRPRPINPENWILQSDYPIGAAAMNQSGIVGFEVEVSDVGLVTRCAVVQPSGWPLLDEWTCRLITERARFTAALDEQGRPTTGRFRSRIQWRLPPEPAPAPVVPPQ